MNQQERREYLINYLLAERGEKVQLPQNEGEQRRFLRSLMNVRPPKDISREFTEVQNEYLQEETAHKGITDIDELTPIQSGIFLWQGDITTLKCDGIVNAANSQMLGCFCPCHGCIDNAIHTFSGVQLRGECAEIMRAQGFEEPTGKAKITKAYNLPCKYIIHTVGPIVYGRVTAKNKRELESCYRSCLELAEQNGLKSIAFCCISTGEFHFPINKYAHKRVLLLELGVGGNTPVIIKYPFWRLTMQNKKAAYACINMGEALCPKEIEKQSIIIDGDIKEVLENLKI